jgi:transcriptional regulator with XRE-family HTH domain
MASSTQKRTAASKPLREVVPSAASIGARLAQLRKVRGITQVELAALLDVTQPVVSAYERGAVTLRAEQIALLAQRLRVSADVLLGLKGPSSSAPVTTSTADSRLARRLRDARTLPRRDKEALLRTLDAFLAAKTPSRAA